MLMYNPPTVCSIGVAQTVFNVIDALFTRKNVFSSSALIYFGFCFVKVNHNCVFFSTFFRFKVVVYSGRVHNKTANENEIEIEIEMK